MKTQITLLISTIVLAASTIAIWRWGLVASDENQPITNPDSNSTDHREQRLDKATPRVQDTWFVEDFEDEIVQFKTVFWESADTESLRKLIRTTDLVKDKTVLEIGTGTGLVSLCCLKAGARRVIATDVNPAAIANARHNATRLGLSDDFETRLVPIENSGAFYVIESNERFDLIISNPPWENKSPRSIDEYAFYDENFALLRSLLEGLRRHLSVDGKALLAYGHVDAIRKIDQLAHEFNLRVRILDNRQLDDLPNDFLPGMLLEISPR